MNRFSYTLLNIPHKKLISGVLFFSCIAVCVYYLIFQNINSLSPTDLSQVDESTKPHFSDASDSFQLPSSNESAKLFRRYEDMNLEERRIFSDRIRKDSENSDDPRKTEILKSVAQTIETKRWILLGYFGDLMLMPEKEFPKDHYLSMIDMGDGNYTVFDTGENTGKLLYIISKDGTISDVSERSLNSQERIPTKWPIDPSSSEIILPSEGIIVSHEEFANVERGIPKDALGWLFMAFDKSLIAPSFKAMSMPPNCIIVTRSNDGGLLLNHSGPAEKDSYAQVFPDGRMKYLFEESDPEVSYYWPFFSTENCVAFPGVGFVASHKLLESHRIIILSNGGAIFGAPPNMALEQ